jgi:hypothetical protein
MNLNSNRSNADWETDKMRSLALAVAAVSAFLVVTRWGTPEAIAWTVAFCGWLPHVFEDKKETDHGHQA